MSTPEHSLNPFCFPSVETKHPNNVVIEGNKDEDDFAHLDKRINEPSVSINDSDDIKNEILIVTKHNVQSKSMKGKNPE